MQRYLLRRVDQSHSGAGINQYHRICDSQGAAGRSRRACSQPWTRRASWIRKFWSAIEKRYGLDKPIVTQYFELGLGA